MKRSTRRHGEKVERYRFVMDSAKYERQFPMSTMCDIIKHDGHRRFIVIAFGVPIGAKLK